MTLTVSEYLLRDFVVERVDAALFELAGAGSLRLPASSRAYFHIVLAGSMRLRLEDGAAPVELHSGDVAFLLYGAAHTLQRHGVRAAAPPHTHKRWASADTPPLIKVGSGSGELRVLSGSLQLARTLRSAPVNRALSHVLHYTPEPPVDMAQLQDAACRGPGASAFVFALAQLHLVQLLRRVHDDFQQIFPVRLGAPDMGRMAVIVRKMREHPERRWTVASLAQEIGCSRSSFAAKFQAYAGVGPIRYAAQTRLAHAAAMLKDNPELPLWEVAKRVGYDTQGSFTRAFKAQFGVPPRLLKQRGAVRD